VIGRRTLLLRGLALGAGAIVTACSSKGSGDGATTASTTLSTDAAGGESSPSPAGTGADATGGTAAPLPSAPVDTSGTVPAGGFVVVQRYPNTSLTPGSVRLPVSIARDDGTLLSDGPATVTGRILDADGDVVATVSADKHGVEMVQPYWPVNVELPAAGVYFLQLDGALGEPVAFQLFEPAAVALPTVGSKLQAFDTPTTDDPREVDPLCTRSPDPCPYHDVTLTDALASGKPVVYMIGTPAHCQTGTCAPGLEYLIETTPAYGDDVLVVHAEVYKDNAATEVAPAVTAAGLDYEPVIFVTDAEGTVVERIDIIWDDADLSAILERALS
jgi:hypothetical protein